MTTKTLKSFVGMCLLSTQLLIFSSAFAKGGSMDGGGGDAVLKGASSAQLLDLAEVGDLEYLSPNGILSRFEKLSNKITEEGLLLKYSKGAFHDPLNEDLFSFYIQKSLNVPGAFWFSEDEFIKKPIQMEFYFSNNPLAEINDEGKIYIGEEYNKIQLAIQNPKGQVVIYKPLFDKLSPKDQAALLLHEALLRLVWQYNPDHLSRFGTEHIRKLNCLIFKKIDGEFIPQNVMVEAIKILGIKTLGQYFE